MKKTLAFLAAVIASTLLCAGEPPKQETPSKDQPSPRQKPHRMPPRHRRKGYDHFRRGPGLWRAFAELSEKERKEMIELQRSNPDKFKEIMGKKVDLLIQAEKAERETLRQLAEQFRSGKDEAEKAAVRAKIKAIMQNRFVRHLNNNRRQLEEMRKRANALEQKLNEREKNSGKIVDFQVEKLLSRPPRKHR